MILHGKSAQRLDPPSTSVEEKPLTPLAPNHKEQVKVKAATTWISNKTNRGHDWKVPTTLLKAQGYGKKWKDCWVPKSSYMRHPLPGVPTRSPSHPHLSRCSQLTSGCPKAQPPNLLLVLNHRQSQERSLASNGDLKRQIPQQSKLLQLPQNHLSKPQPCNGDRSSNPQALSSH